MRDAERRELPSEARPLLRGGVREALPQPPLGRVDVELAPRLRVDEPDVADVRQLLLARVPDLDRDDRVPGGEPEQRRPPVARAAEVGDDHGERALPRDPGDLREGGADRGPPDPLGLRLAPDGEQDAEQADPPLPRTQQHGVVSPPKVATPIRLPRREARWPSATATPSATSHLRRSAVPKRIDGETSSRTHDVSARSATSTRTCTVVRARRGVPVDPADVVARLPLADLRELGADRRAPPSGARRRAGRRSAGRSSGRAPAAGPPGAARARDGRACALARSRGGHAARSTRSISGTGTASRTESTIESAPTSAASAS